MQVSAFTARQRTHLERLWSRNITITMRLVDTVTTSMLPKTVQSGKVDPRRLIKHRFKLNEILQASTTQRKLMHSKF